MYLGNLHKKRKSKERAHLGKSGAKLAIGQSMHKKGNYRKIMPSEKVGKFYKVKRE